MLPRFKELKRLEAHTKRKKIRSSLKHSSLKIDYNECKQAIPLTREVYCGIWKEKVSEDLCMSCPHFDPEPLEYKLFRRT